jgi:hypothetical protein
MGKIWPSQKAHPRGAKLKPTILISAKNGSDIVFPLFFHNRFLNVFYTFSFPLFIIIEILAIQ